MKIFFDVDGVLIDGWHADPARRKRWDADLRRDLGIDPEALQEKFFRPSSEGKQHSLMQACTRGDLDLKEALAPVLPSVCMGASPSAPAGHGVHFFPAVARPLRHLAA